MNITPENAHRLLAALQFEHYARQCLDKGEYERHHVWAGMVDEHLVAVTGFTRRHLQVLADEHYKDLGLPEKLRTCLLKTGA